MENIKEIFNKYDTILFDAYGVLVNSECALPFAVEAIQYLESIDKSLFILTNDSSKTPQTAVEKYKKFGFNFSPEQIISSGSLLKDYFSENNLQGARSLVLGPEDAKNYILEAQGQIVSIDEEFEVLVICDETGYPFLETIDLLISKLFQKFDRGEKVKLLLPNPDLIFTKSDTLFGITSGSIALLIESALKIRYGDNCSFAFEKLGKPYPRIYQEAFKKSKTMNMLMVGDQIETDIKGASNFGIDSLLLNSGVANIELKNLEYRPTYVLNSLNIVKY